VEINLGTILCINPHPNSGYITMGDNAATNAPVYDQAGSISWVHPIPPSDVKGIARGEIPWFGLMKLYVTNGNIPPRTPANSVTDLIISLIALTVLPFLYDFVIGPYIDRKYGEDEEIVNAIASHHEDIPVTSMLGIILQIADAISGARPGARRELLEAYIKRIKELEAIASSFEGVEKAFAIQAGREIRVIVDDKKISDDQAYELAREIAQKIEKELTYPGIIRVTVIRETRAIEYAK